MWLLSARKVVPIDAARSPLWALALLVGVVPLASCTAATSDGASVTITLRLDDGLPWPSELRLDWLASGTFVFRDRLVPVVKEAGPDRTLATVRIELPAEQPVQRAVVARARLGASVTAEGAARLTIAPHEDRRLSVTLGAQPLPDRDGDGIPDVVDDCPDSVRPICGGADAGVDRDDPADATRGDDTAARPLDRVAPDFLMPDRAADTAALDANLPDEPAGEVARDAGREVAVDLAPDLPPDLAPDLPLPPRGTGLKAEYFPGPDQTGAPALVRIDPTVDFYWAKGAPDPRLPVDGFSARWTGQLLPQFTELYMLHVISDDRNRLWIDGVMLNDFGPTRSVSVSLVAGRLTPIRIDYQEDAGDATIKFEWSSPSQPRQVVPKLRLYPAP